MTNFSKLGDWFWCDYDKIDSTNNELKKLVLLSGEKNKIIITAKEQTAGKGRLDHQWISLMGNLFMSLGINWNLQNIGILSLISALALYKTIKIYSPTKEILLKWPNDVFIDRKKVSGILIESVSSSFAIIGIGVNIEKTPTLDTQPSYLPTSLKDQKINTDRLEFMQNYLNSFDDMVSIFFQQGSSAIIDMWQKNALGLGNNIRVKTSNEEFFGKFIGLDKHGMLLLQLNNNKIKTISSGDVYF